MQSDTVPLAYSIKEACSVSSIGRTRLYQLIKSGQIKVTRIGRRTLVDAASLRLLVTATDAS
jgi:excisionase family DNA binding protein